ncbi:MAG: MBL fold metallo-hydrolase [Deltaproteobacteria bacterium]|nr:MBL fold metallo-hydrolase [Deltaproteobacteria bacterium]
MTNETLHLSEGRTLHQYRGRASNQYILEDHTRRSTFLVDCGMPSDTRGLLDALKGMPPLKRVVCTHFHVDHVSGWIQLKRYFPAAEIWFHEKAEPLVAGSEAIPLPGFKAWIEVLFPCMRESGYLPGLGNIFNGGLYGTPFKKGFPEERVRYFTQGDDVLPGFTAIHTPGHRPDHVSYFESRSGVLISGDFIIVMGGRIVPNSFLASPKDQAASLEKIINTPGISIICPGHGSSSLFDYTRIQP